jgi:hypothetical protein
MMRFFFLLMVGALFMALPATSVMATPPTNVLIEVEITMLEDGQTAGTFTATGGICSSGHTADVFVHIAGFPSERRLQMLIGREFTCEDGSGTFLLLVRVHGQFEQPGSEVFIHPIPKSWSVLNGTGAFEGLHGAGTGFGVPTEHGFFDTFTGRMHIAHEGRR